MNAGAEERKSVKDTVVVHNTGSVDDGSGEMSMEDIYALAEENVRLKEELRIRDNDILSHDQVFDSIVAGTLQLILVMSVSTF